MKALKQQKKFLFTKIKKFVLYYFMMCYILKKKMINFFNKNFLKT